MQFAEIKDKTRLFERIVAVTRVWAVALVPVCFACSPTDTRIADLFYEMAPDAGNRVLFLRRQPIVTVAIGFEQEQLNWMTDVVMTYAHASGLPITFSPTHANLIVIRTSGTHHGARLNPSSLSKFDFLAGAIPLMSELDIWGGGCGVYNFRTRDGGSISGSIGIVDTELAQDDQNVCTSFILAGAFGIGGGLKDGTKLPREQNVYRNAYALAIVSDCDRKNADKAIQEVRACISDREKSNDVEGNL